MERLSSRLLDPEYLVAGVIFFALAAIQLRALLPYFAIGGAPPAISLYYSNPSFTFVVPQLQIQWIISPAGILALMSAPMGATVMAPLLLAYLLTLTAEGFLFFVYAKLVLSDLLSEIRLPRVIAPYFGALVYMSQPVYNIGNLAWLQSMQTYALLPLVLLCFHLAVKSKTTREFVLPLLIGSLALSYAFVIDSHSVVILPAALLVQVGISALLMPGLKWHRLPLTLLALLTLAVAVAAPAFDYLLSQHYLNSGYFYFTRVSTSTSNSWANASPLLWMFLENDWWNRTAVLQTTFVQDSTSFALVMGLSSLLPVVGFSSLLWYRKPPVKRLVVYLSAVALFLLGIYSVFPGGYSIVYSAIPIDSPFAHILAEGLLPVAILSIIYSTFVTLVIQRFSAARAPGVTTRTVGVQCKSTSPIGVRFRQAVKAIDLQRRSRRISPSAFPVWYDIFRRRDPTARLRLFRAGVVICVVVAVCSVSAQAYVYGVGPEQHVGNVLPANLVLTKNLAEVADYLYNHQDGYAIWFPKPPQIGVGNYLYATSTPYPIGSDSPFSTGYLNYAFSTFGSSLYGSHDWQALSYFEANIGVRYNAIWTTNARELAQSMTASGYFSVVLQAGGAFLLTNRGFQAMAEVSPYSVYVTGGYGTLAGFVPLLSSIYQGARPVALMTDVSPLPLNGLHDNRTLLLTTDPIQTVYSLSVLEAGLGHAYAPSLDTNHFDPSSQWSPGNVADAGGFPWTWYVGNMANYTWPSTYTVNDGVLYTYSSSADFSFHVSENASGTYEVLVRTLERTDKPLGYTVTVGGERFNISIPQSPYGGFVWVPLGTASLRKGLNSVELHSYLGGGLNLVDAIPLASWERAFSGALNVSKDLPMVVQPPDGLLASNPYNTTLVDPGSYELIPGLGGLPSSTVLFQERNTTFLYRNKTSISVVDLPASVPVSSFSNGTAVAFADPFNGSDSVSVSVWFNFPSNITEPAEVLAAQWNRPGVQNWNLWLARGNTVVWTVGGSTWTNLARGGLNPGQWYMATGEFANNTMELYLDGRLVASKQHLFNLTEGQNTTVGQYEYNGLGRYYNGTMGSVVESPWMPPETISELYAGALPLGHTTDSAWITFIGEALPVGSPGLSFSMTNLSEGHVRSATLPLGVLSTTVAGSIAYPFTANTTVFPELQLSAGNLSVTESTPGFSIELAHQLPKAYAESPPSISVGLSSSPPGPIVTRIRGAVPRSEIAQPLYISIAGFGPQLARTSAVLGGSVGPLYSAVAFGVTQGFVLPNGSTGSDLNLSVTWFPLSSQDLTANLVSYSTLSCMLALVLVTQVRYRWQRRRRHVPPIE